MTAAGLSVPRADTCGAPLTPIADLLLSRIACDGGTAREEAISDLAPVLAHKLAPAEWRRQAEAEIAALVAGGYVSEANGRVAVFPRGADRAAAFLGRKGTALPSWSTVRDVQLVAKGLGIEKESASRLKMLGRVEGLRALILQTTFRLPQKKNPSPAKLRAQLALVALERAFGNKIKTGLGSAAAFTARAGRTLAGQLASPPRDFTSDQRLVAWLAQESAGAAQPDLDSLRKALLKALGTKILAAQQAAAPRIAVEAPRAIREPANDRGTPKEVVQSAERPDPERFARAVLDAAQKCAEGWPGNRKAFISRVWGAIRESEQAWKLTEIEFKCMLSEAHRMGRVVLANADLKDKRSIAEFESSAIQYKNTVWHFVRVEG